MYQVCVFLLSTITPLHITSRYSGPSPSIPPSTHPGRQGRGACWKTTHCCRHVPLQAEQGKIVMAGALAEPVDGAVFIFKNASKEVRGVGVWWRCLKTLCDSGRGGIRQGRPVCHQRFGAQLHHSPIHVRAQTCLWSTAHEPCTHRVVVP